MVVIKALRTRLTASGILNTSFFFGRRTGANQANSLPALGKADQ